MMRGVVVEDAARLAALHIAHLGRQHTLHSRVPAEEERLQRFRSFLRRAEQLRSSRLIVRLLLRFGLLFRLVLARAEFRL